MIYVRSNPGLDIYNVTKQPCKEVLFFEFFVCVHFFHFPLDFDNRILSTLVAKT